MKEYNTTSTWFDRIGGNVPNPILPLRGTDEDAEWELVNTIIVHDDVEYEEGTMTTLIAWTWQRDNSPRAMLPKPWEADEY
jgi:hypothetical protein